MTASVVVAYAAHNRFPPAELPTVVRAVHRALAALGATAAVEPVRVVQAQIVEQMFDTTGREVVAQPGKQFVMVEVAGLVRSDELTLNGAAPMAVVDNRFVFEVGDTSEMLFAYRPRGDTW